MIAGTNNAVPDASVQGLLTRDITGSAAPEIATATYQNNGAIQAMYPIPTAIDPNDAPTTFPSTLAGTELVETLINNGVYVLCAGINGDSGGLFEVKKALNWATDDTYTLADPTTDSHAVGFKSYDYLVDADLMSRPNLINYGGGNAGAITFQTEDIIQAELDPNLNNRAVNFAGFSGQVNVALDDWYPLVKSRWYNAGTHERNPVSHDGQSITFTAPMSWQLGSPYTVGGGEVTDVNIQWPNLLNPGTTNRIIADNANANINHIGGTTIGDGLALETRNGAEMRLAGVGWAGAVDLTGTFTEVNGQAITASATVDRPVILGDNTDITITNVGSGGEITLRPVTHNGVGVETIRLQSSVPITVRVPPTTTDPTQLPQQWDVAGSAAANVTLLPAAPSPINYVITTGSLAGRFAIRNISTGANLVDPVDVTAGNPRTFRINSLDPATQGDDIVIYYKAENTATMGYTTNIVSLTISALTEETQVPVLESPIATVLYSLIPYTGASLSTAARTGDPGIDITITGATNQTVGGLASQNLMLMATDTEAYFNFMVSNGVTQDIIRAENQATAVTGSTITLIGSGAQQSLRAVSGNPTIEELAGSTGVPSVTLFENPAGATIDDIIQGINGSAVGMDQAAIATNVTAIQTTVTNVETIATTNRRAVGYLVGNGSTTDTNGSRLNGIRPKQSDYVQGTNYEDIL